MSFDLMPPMGYFDSARKKLRVVYLFEATGSIRNASRN
jgi:hypothetical protein